MGLVYSNDEWSLVTWTLTWGHRQSTHRQSIHVGDRSEETPAVFRQLRGSKTRSRPAHGINANSTHVVGLSEPDEKPALETAQLCAKGGMQDEISVCRGSCGGLGEEVEPVFHATIRKAWTRLALTHVIPPGR